MYLLTSASAASPMAAVVAARDHAHATATAAATIGVIRILEDEHMTTQQISSAPWWEATVTIFFEERLDASLHVFETPWGEPDEILRWDTDVYWSSTPRHAGLLLRRDSARVWLTRDAQAIGEAYGDYLCFEGDNAWLPVGYERPDLGPLLMEHIQPQHRSAYLHSGLLAHYPNYAAVNGLAGSNDVDS